MRTKVETKGFRELGEALTELSSRATQTNVKKRVLVSAAEPIAALMRRLAPVHLGILRSAIAIETKQPRPKRDKSYYGVVIWLQRGLGYRALKTPVAYAGRRGKRMAPRDYAYGSSPDVYGKFAEFGTSRQKAFPFMRPAWKQEGGMRALARIRIALRVEIGKAVERARRKALKAMK